MMIPLRRALIVQQHGVLKYPEGTACAEVLKAGASAESQGILNRQLPWGLVLLGVMIALVLEMSGVNSLAFAVGVYLPLSTTSPIFMGGIVRWLGDRYVRRKHARKALTEEQLTLKGTRARAYCSHPATSPAAPSPAS